MFCLKQAILIKASSVRLHIKGNFVLFLKIEFSEG